MKSYTGGAMIPMLNVKDVGKSLDFYQKALGFELVSPVEDLAHFRWGIIGCNGTELMLSESENAPQTPKINPLQNSHWSVNFYFYPPDIKGLHAHLKDIQLAPTPLTDTDYGMTEFSVQDPDGHILSFGADAKK